jgi:hypothetical protein
LRLSNIEFHLVAQGVGRLQPHTSKIFSADLGREQEFHKAEHLPIVVGLWFRRENCAEFLSATLASVVATRLSV